MSGRVLFTVAVLAVFIAAIVYTAVCARAAVAAEAEAEDMAMAMASGDHVTSRDARPMVAASPEPGSDVLDDLRRAA